MDLSALLNSLEEIKDIAKVKESELSMLPIEQVSNTAEQAIKDFNNLKLSIATYKSSIAEQVKYLERVKNGELRMSSRTLEKNIKSLYDQIITPKYDAIIQKINSIDTHAKHNDALFQIAQTNPQNFTETYYFMIQNTISNYRNVIIYANEFIDSIEILKKMLRNCANPDAMQSGGSKKSRSGSSKNKISQEKKPEKPKSKPSSAKPKSASKPVASKPTPKSKPISAKPKKLYKKPTTP